MTRKSFDYLPMDRLHEHGANPAKAWIWPGYLARGNLTLLTSIWKAGKTTLIAGLLRQLGAGGDFLGRVCPPAKVIVVSEESRDLWAARLALHPLGGPHARLLPRPFLTRPTPAQWRELIDQAMEQRAASALDLFVVDPLATFLPGHSESDPGTLLELLQPLQRLAESGVAVLILHHPRKQQSEPGSSARGSGALLGFVDIALELHAFSKMKCDERRRRLIALSRHRETPRLLAYEWDPGTGIFTTLDDYSDSRFVEHWEQLRMVLERRKSSGTLTDILTDWTDERDKPATTTLLRWLHRALDEKLVRREGRGRKNEPFRYRLPNTDDAYWDRGELPPLRELMR